MPRVPWAELPSHIQSWVADVLGSDVVGADTQPGGFSPGAACRLRLGRRPPGVRQGGIAACQPGVTGMHRQEAVAAVAGYFTRQALLPAPASMPTVRGFQAAQGEHARAWLRERTGWD
jgi:hypothetical protein